MAVEFTGKYISYEYHEYDSPGGALPVPNHSKTVDLTGGKYVSYLLVTREGPVFKLTSIICKSFLLKSRFVLDEEIEDVMGDRVWKVYTEMKPDNTLKVTRYAETDGSIDVRVTQYRFSKESLVVTTMREDTDEVIVAYKFTRMTPEEAAAHNLPDNE